MGSAIPQDAQIQSLDILQIEEDAKSAFHTARLLKQSINVELNLHQTTNLDSALSLVQDNPFDAIILDLHLPDASGLEAVRCIHRRFPNRAIVIMTTKEHEEQAKQAMLFGAQDYLLKDTCDGDSLWRSLRHAIERKRYEEKLDFLAKSDLLTGLANRRHCMERLSQHLSSLKRYGGEGALLYLDLDKFKWVNDNLGHEKGDQLLMIIAERLTKCVRHGDLVARMGGDAFILLLERVKHPLFASQVAEKVIEICNLPVQIDGQDVFVGASVGIAMCDNTSEDPDTVLKQADLAMYRAKECGRNNFQFYTRELNVHAKGRAILANSLHQAIEKKELELFYQPKVSVDDDRLLGAEALLRWNHPSAGLLMPDVFIPLLEETGLIVPVGDWVLERASRQFNTWFKNGLLSPHHKVAINLSAGQFIYNDLVSSVNQILESTGLPADMLELDLTESILMASSEANDKKLQSLRQLGVQIAIDDFGTGHSCLASLSRFPITSLKIDRSFLASVTQIEENATICSAVISLAHALGLSVTAEGVENSAALDFLKQLNCEQYQGYYFSPPMPGKDFEAMLRCNKERIKLN